MVWPIDLRTAVMTPRAQARAARLCAKEAKERREDQAVLVTTPVSHLRTITSIIPQHT